MRWLGGLEEISLIVSQVRVVYCVAGGSALPYIQILGDANNTGAGASGMVCSVHIKRAPYWSVL